MDIRRIEKLALTDEEKQMILGENSRRLYFSQSDELGGLTEAFEIIGHWLIDISRRYLS